MQENCCKVYLSKEKCSQRNIVLTSKFDVCSISVFTNLYHCCNFFVYNHLIDVSLSCWLFGVCLTCKSWSWMTFNDFNMLGTTVFTYSAPFRVNIRKYECLAAKSFNKAFTFNMAFEHCARLISVVFKYLGKISCILFLTFNFMLWS